MCRVTEGDIVQMERARRRKAPLARPLPRRIRRLRKWAGVTASSQRRHSVGRSGYAAVSSDHDPTKTFSAVTSSEAQHTSSQAFQEDLPFFVDIEGDEEMLPSCSFSVPDLCAAHVSRPTICSKSSCLEDSKAPSSIDGGADHAAFLQTITFLKDRKASVEASTEDPMPVDEDRTTPNGILQQYLKETKDANQNERRKRLTESLRYFGGEDSTDTGIAARAASLLHSDDGFLTKLGAKTHCVICVRGSHKPWDCPEARCFICYQTGHSVKNCPHAKEKCDRCSRKGHGKENCIWDVLVDAARPASLSQVHCIRCGEIGHAMCGDPYAKPAQEARVGARAMHSALRGSWHTGNGWSGGWSSGWSSGSQQTGSWNDHRGSDQWEASRVDSSSSGGNVGGGRGTGCFVGRGGGRGVANGTGRGGRSCGRGWKPSPDDYLLRASGRTQHVAQMQTVVVDAPNIHAELRSKLANQNGRSGACVEGRSSRHHNLPLRESLRKQASGGASNDFKGLSRGFAKRHLSQDDREHSNKDLKRARR